MSQFTNYDNLSSDYVPFNLYPTYPDFRIEIDNSLPRKLYDYNKVLIGYNWSYGDTLSIPVSVNRTITVDSNAIIYETSGESPDDTVLGTAGQQAYNTVDGISWTCLTSTSPYEWSEDEKLTYPWNGSLEVELTPDMEGKSIYCTISNFRREVLYTYTFSEVNTAEIAIDRETSEDLVNGIYYLDCYVVTQDDEENIETSYQFDELQIYVGNINDQERVEVW